MKALLLKLDFMQRIARGEAAWPRIDSHAVL
jgi:hypothetical protein